MAKDPSAGPINNMMSKFIWMVIVQNSSDIQSSETSTVTYRMFTFARLPKMKVWNLCWAYFQRFFFAGMISGHYLELLNFHGTERCIISSYCPKQLHRLLEAMAVAHEVEESRSFLMFWHIRMRKVPVFYTEHYHNLADLPDTSLQ